MEKMKKNARSFNLLIRLYIQSKHSVGNFFGAFILFYEIFSFDFVFNESRLYKRLEARREEDGDLVNINPKYLPQWSSSDLSSQSG